ncbi:MAG: aspartate/glutamate racemase family protein [Cyanobacteria bacterium J06632_22]
MKTLGLIGGMSWESTVTYYQILNETVKQRLGGLHSAEILLYSVDFEPIEQLQHQQRWDEAGALLARVVQRLESGGAEAIVLCTNTMHKVADVMMQATSLPLIHIADATAQAILQQQLTTVGLLGTQFTMAESFYKSRLVDQGLTVQVPGEADQCIVHRIIYDELCQGTIKDESRQEYRRVIQSLVDQGCEGIILGCTEIGLLVSAADSTVPLFDTTQIHAIAAADWALQR